jgi:hypothetical protein
MSGKETFRLTSFRGPSRGGGGERADAGLQARNRAESVAIRVQPFEGELFALVRPRAFLGRRKSRSYIPFMDNKRPLRSIPDNELLHRLAELMGQSRRVEADIVAHIAEVEERRLYAREAFPSMFAYCMDVLHLSEAEAYLRILAARVSLLHPVLLTMLSDGRLHLTAIVKLAPHLTIENRDGLLERATHRSKRQILELVAEIAPRPDVPVVVRKLPERRTLPLTGPVVVPSHGGCLVLGLGPDLTLGLGRGPTLELRPDGVATPQPGARQDEATVSQSALPTQGPAVAREGSVVPASRNVFASPMPPPVADLPVPPPVVASPMPPPVVQPLSPGRYKVQFTASADFHHKLERLQALMGSRAPGGDLAAVMEQAVTEKLERLEARRFAQTRAHRERHAETETERSPDPSPSSRHIPAAVRRAVRARDGDRCRYVDEQGRRCPERDRLEFHHRRPFGLGGDHSVLNVGLLCRGLNAYLAECDYGSEAMARHRRAPSKTPGPRPVRRAVPESPA